MNKSRSLKYLGLFALVLAALAIIFFPTGPRPQAKPFTVTLAAPRPWLQLIDPKKKLAGEADAALNKEFSQRGDKLPGELTIATPNGILASQSTQATVDATASTREDARATADRVVKALNAKFKGIKLAPETEAAIKVLPRQPLFAAGEMAVFPPQERNGRPIPAVKLGLDLQGGVNLVLLVLKALFTYTFDTKVGSDADSRYKFTSRVRDALKKYEAQNGGGLKLDEADVNLAEDQSNVLEVRTQAADRSTFEAQKGAIASALKAVSGVKFSPAREPQFFEPDKNDKQSGFSQSALLDNMVEIVRSRVDRLGVSEPQIQAQPPDRIIVQLPGIQDPQQAVATIGKTAQMEIRLMPQTVTPTSDPQDPDVTLFRDSKSGQIVSYEQIKQTFPVIVGGADLKPTSRSGFDQNNQPAVFFELQADAARKFAEATTVNRGRLMPIFLDERCISAPRINEPITQGSGQISGGFKTLKEAGDLAVLLNSGALPAPIDVVENRTISATLGEDSLMQSLRAGLIGIIAVMIFMIVFYRLPGVLSDCALVIYCVLNLAAFILVGGTLTLPGIAGFLLALAMSLDTNILIFERLKEEMMIQPNFSSALRAAFSRAWTAILDSHVTTLIAAGVLFFLGTGPVKGFALTLAIGVLLSLFSAISVTHLFLWSIVHIGETNHRLFAGKLPDVVSAPAKDAGA
jgi:protein-export membrane protein SecD